MGFDTDTLRRAVAKKISGKRFDHILGVESMAARLGEIYLPDAVDELRCAALLHDITKNETKEKQLQYLAEFGIIIDNFDVMPDSLYHQVTGAVVVRRDYPLYATESVTSAVRWHTTGRWGMTLFETLIFLADYIEEKRAYESCATVRREFFDADIANMTDEERLIHLYRAVITVIDNTMAHLVSAGEYVDPNSVECRNYFLELIQKKGVIS